MEQHARFFALVTDAPYFAAGDGVTNDRAVIQRALDDAYAAGGGEVMLTAWHTFLTAGLVLRTGVTLRFGDGATLLQSPDPSHYVKPAGEGYEPYTPHFGHNWSEQIKWSHNWYRNYPLIFAPAGSHHFAVKGRGVIEMMRVTDPEKIIKICPIGFYRCTDFEIADVHITNYHSYAIMPFTCRRGLFKNLKIDNWSHGNGDGICLMNCSDVRVTGCTMYTGDDAVYIFSSYRDPRRSEWWNSDEPQPSENIEIDHNDLKTNHCKAFGMILWGIDCPAPEQVEVRGLYVHDNRFETMGNWLYNPYTTRGGHPPVTDVQFENNRVGGIEINFYETYMSNVSGYRCMPALLNGHFEDGRVFWCLRPNGAPDSAGVRREEAGGPYGYIDRLDLGGAEIFEGVYLEAGRPLLFRAETAGGGQLFVRAQTTGETVAAQPFLNDDWTETLLYFTVPRSGNYHVGLNGGDARTGGARLRHAVLGSHPAADGCGSVHYDRGKMIFYP